MGFGTNTCIKRVKDRVLLNNQCVCHRPELDPYLYLIRL
jgi:hypothetical protein